MPADHIPDLRTLLGNRRGGAASRGRGRGGGFAGASPEHVRDNAVKSTDQDAAGSRLSCVELGYLDDAYAQLFAKNPTTRRLPLLNRGTYVRTSAIDQLVDRFLAASPSSTKQIISLGAGTDTRYFRLLDKYPDVHLLYHELDFPSNTSEKLATLSAHPRLRTLLSSRSPSHPMSSAASYSSDFYNLSPVDLRDLATNEPTPPSPRIPRIDPSIPTLILSEMCLVYLQPKTVSDILNTLLTHYLPASTPVSLILYEPILPNDAFGRTMTSNLATRNIHLPTLSAYPELVDQRARLKAYGFVDGAKAVDTEWIWKDWVSEAEKERVAQLEFLDEHEELDLLLRHYCVAFGWRDGGTGVFSRAWGDVQEQGG